MVAVPMKKEEGPPAWDKPLALLMIFIAIVVILYFILTFAGPSSAIAP